MRPAGGAEELSRSGTTAMRALESAADKEGIHPMESDASVFIRPGFLFRAADALLTNFHLPNSPPLILVCAFGGINRMRDAYKIAAEKKFLFYSYGRRNADSSGAKMKFTVLSQDGFARCGALEFARGEIQTPVFMPVGTVGAVKTLMPDEIEERGGQKSFSPTRCTCGCGRDWK